MSKLFSPLRIKNTVLRNRIAVSPMCQYSSVDGFATDWHLVHLGSRAVGGAGLIIAEATAICPEGRISPDDLGIWKEDHVVKLKQITDFIKSQGAVAGIQLAHAGRKASTYAPWKGNGYVSPSDGGWEVLAPSDIPFSSDYGSPIAMTPQDIGMVVDSFKKAAVLAKKAGFQIIELHAAHGYLIHQFLSPLSNQRTDEYGGSFENRTRLLLQVVDAVRSVLPADFPLFVRISATDWADGGWTLEDSIQLSSDLGRKGIDLIDVSTGGLVATARIPVGPAYQTPFSDAIKKNTGMLTGTVGMITEPRQAETILEEERADLILMARELLRDPYFPLHAASQLESTISWPDQYLRAKKS